MWLERETHLWDRFFPWERVLSNPGEGKKHLSPKALALGDPTVASFFHPWTLITVIWEADVLWLARPGSHTGSHFFCLQETKNTIQIVRENKGNLLPHNRFDFKKGSIYKQCHLGSDFSFSLCQCPMSLTSLSGSVHDPDNWGFSLHRVRMILCITPCGQG